MAQTETFDPKTYTPFAPGVPSRGRAQHVPDASTRRSTTSSSRRGSSSIGSVIDKGAVIRTFTAADLGFILHSRHQYHWHTGYIPPQPMAMPHIGVGDLVARSGRRTRTCRRSSPSGRRSRARGEIAHAEGVPHRRLPRHRSRAVPDRRSAGRGVGGAAAEGAGRGAVHEPARSCSRSCSRRSRSISTAATFQRESLVRSLDVGRSPAASPSAKAFDLSLEPKAVVRRLQHRPLRAGLPARAAPGRSAARATSRSPPNTSRSSTGTRTRTATSAPPT